MSRILHRLRRIVPGSEGEPEETRTDGGTVIDRNRPDSGPLGRVVDRVDGRFGSDFVESLPFWLPAFLLVGLFVYGA
ncbi:MAG: sugar ABC transporter permease, partial [Halobacteriales archaeon]|nr:sugar ABC transporter permease [Halobacteriales archaeon]